MVTALTAVAALVFTGLSLKSTRDQLDIAQTQQITERYMRAVEHLGDDRTTDVRLGAVLALERIARDSAADREAVGHLLTTFIRRKRSLEGGPCAQGLGPDEADVEAALRIVSTGQLLAAPDLSHTCLSGTDMDDALLRCAVLQGVYLQDPTTTLVGADLRHADLTGARLDSSDSEGIHPEGIQLGAILNEVDLEGANLANAKLGNTYLMKADLHGADLSGTTLTGARLSDADLRDANLSDADLRGADLRRVKWRGTLIGGSTFGSPAARETALSGGAVDDVGKPTELTCTA